MAKEKTERPRLGALLKDLPSVATPIQEVRPVEISNGSQETKKIGRPEKVKTEPTEHFNIYPPESLAQDVRIYKARTKMSIQDIANEALREYLEKRGALTTK